MIRLGQNADIERINIIRKEVHGIHAEGESGIFKPEFSRELSDYIHEYIDSDHKWVYVYEEDGTILGYMMVDMVLKVESPMRYEGRYLEVCELGVAGDNKSKGIGTKLVDKVKELAIEQGVDSVELNMWEFNDRALKFYEKCGFETYRRHMRVKVGK